MLTPDYSFEVTK